jgi:hypothetical protein
VGVDEEEIRSYGKDVCQLRSEGDRFMLSIAAAYSEPLEHLDL